MEENKVMSDNFMMVGKLAKRMGTTVRTLQYYDREGLLSPSGKSPGGRRLYTYKDMIRLHQIQALKSLGFTLDAIKNRLITLDTPAEVEKVLMEQESEKLRIPVIAFHSPVHFQKYSLNSQAGVQLHAWQKLFTWVFP